MTTTDTANASDATEEHSDSNETSGSDWEYVGLTTYTTTSMGPETLGIESVRAVRGRPNSTGPNGYQHRVVYLDEDARQCPPEGANPDEPREAAYQRVGVVSNHLDGGAEILGVVYATPEGDRWYWCPWDDRLPDVGEQNGYLPVRQVEKPPDDQPDRAAELIGWLNPEASWKDVEAFVNELDDSNVVEWFKADIEPEDFPNATDGGGTPDNSSAADYGVAVVAAGDDPGDMADTLWAAVPEEKLAALVGELRKRQTEIETGWMCLDGEACNHCGGEKEDPA